MSNIAKVDAATQTPRARQSQNAAAQFSSILDRLKNGAQQSAGSDEETKSIIERTVVVGPDGSKTLVVTQVTLKPNGQRSETKVLSRQKIASPCEGDALSIEERREKKKDFAEYAVSTDAPASSATQQKAAQAGITGLLRPEAIPSDLL